MGTKQPVAPVRIIWVWVRIVWVPNERGYETTGKRLGTFSAIHWQPEHLFTSFPIAVKYKEGENQQHSARKSRLQYFFIFYAGRSGLREIWIK